LPACHAGHNAHKAWKWCARESAAGQSVQSAVDADSCFCLINSNLTYYQAIRACAMMGGFLTDIQNEAENAMLNNLVNTNTDKSSSPVSSSPWIGLKKTSNGLHWYNCLTFLQPGYIQLDAVDDDSPLHSAYTLGKHGRWNKVNVTSASNYAICRLDRNLNGRHRNPCSSAYFNEK